MQNIWEYWSRKVWNSVDISVQDAELLTYPFCQQYKEESKEANAKHLSDSGHGFCQGSTSSSDEFLLPCLVPVKSYFYE